MTEQRRTILKVLERSEDHLDVDAVYKKSSEIDSKVSIATVYRTLKLLEDADVIIRHDFGKGRSFYEVTSEDHHDHLIDAETGKIIEFYDQKLEDLKSEIAERLGYKLIDHKLDLYGVKKK